MRYEILYRLYGAEGALLYVGITNNLNRRLTTHALQQPWWSEVANIRVECYPTRAKVADAEVAAIVAERPRYNITGTTPRAYAKLGVPQSGGEVLTVRLDEELFAKLQAAAKLRTGGNLSAMARIWIEDESGIPSRFGDRWERDRWPAPTAGLTREFEEGKRDEP